MLSNKTKELFAAFLESLQEDTGLEPETVEFWQYDHNGNTTEEHANTLVSKFGADVYKHEDYSTATFGLKSNGVKLRTYYSYRPEEPEENLVTCKECEKDFEPVDMDTENEEYCLKCSHELKKEWDEEQKAQLRDWIASR